MRKGNYEETWTRGSGVGVCVWPRVLGHHRGRKRLWIGPMSLLTLQPTPALVTRWHKMCLSSLLEAFFFFFHFQYCFFQYPPSSTKKGVAVLWQSWETLTRHLSCSYSPMFDLIAFPPLCATALSSPGSDGQCWKPEGKVLLFWQSGEETRLTWPTLTWLAFPWCCRGWELEGWELLKSSPCLCLWYLDLKGLCRLKGSLSPV